MFFFQVQRLHFGKTKQRLVLVNFFYKFSNTYLYFFSFLGSGRGYISKERLVFFKFIIIFKKLTFLFLSLGSEAAFQKFLFCRFMLSGFRGSGSGYQDGEFRNKISKLFIPFLTYLLSILQMYAIRVSGIGFRISKW